MIKDLRCVAYDPHSETIFAVLQGKLGGDHQSQTILEKIPECSERIGDSDQIYSAQLEEMKSKEQSTSQLRSLASMKKDNRVTELEAFEKGEPQYLMPILVAESRSGKQIFNTDTYKEPDCLRFCPSTSSDKVDISLSGNHSFSTFL